MTQNELALAVASGHEEYYVELWKSVKGFVRQRGKKILLNDRNNGADMDDIEQAGMIALLDAARGFDPDRGDFFQLFSWHLKSEFAAACNYRTNKARNDPINYALSVDAPLGNEEEGTLADIVIDPTDYIEEKQEEIENQELHEALERALNRIDRVRAGIIRKHYWNDLTLDYIAQESGRSIENVRGLESSGIQSLRNYKTRRDLQAWLDERTDFYVRVSLNSFKNTHISAVEKIVIRREEITDYYKTHKEVTGCDIVTSQKNIAKTQ